MATEMRFGKVVGVVLAIACLSTLLFVVAAVMLPPTALWPTDEFAAGSWRSTAQSARYKYVKSLLAKDTLVGKEQQDVVQLLGTPSFVEPRGSYLTYVVKEPAGFSIWPQIYLLHIDLAGGR